MGVVKTEVAGFSYFPYFSHIHMSVLDFARHVRDDSQSYVLKVAFEGNL